MTTGRAGKRCSIPARAAVAPSIAARQCSKPNWVNRPASTPLTRRRLPKWSAAHAGAGTSRIPRHLYLHHAHDSGHALPCPERCHWLGVYQGRCRGLWPSHCCAHARLQRALWDYPGPRTTVQTLRFRAGGWPARGQDVGQNWEHMVRVWYDTVGYDPETGKPFPATLEELGLKELIPALWG